MWLVDERSGVQDGYYAKCLYPDTPSGRQAGWQMLDLIVGALFPEGYKAIFEPEKSGCLTTTKQREVIRAHWAFASPKARREHLREIGTIGGKIGGHARAAKLSKRRRRQIARQGALARWARHAERTAVIAFAERHRTA
jgi:hypothetical protein